MAISIEDKLKNKNTNLKTQRI